MQQEQAMETLSHQLGECPQMFPKNSFSVPQLAQNLSVAGNKCFENVSKLLNDALIAKKKQKQNCTFIGSLPCPMEHNPMGTQEI